MKRLEEQVVAYLDGLLPSGEREEMLREITASSEGRQLLGAHIRMSGLMTHSAKPVSAPLEAQRELAAKLPLLAMKLPYLAMPVKDRRPMAAWFGMSGKVAAGVAAALLVAGGGVWYALSTSNHASTPTNIAQNVQPTAPSVSSPSNSMPTTSIPTAITPSSSGSIARTHHANHANSNSGNVTSHLSSSNATKPPASTTPKTIEAPAENPPAQPQPEQPLPPVAQAENTPRFSGLELANEAANAKPATDLRRFLTTRQSADYIPLRAFATGQGRVAQLHTALSAHTIAADNGITTASKNSYGFEAGLEYELSPWASAGLRGGRGEFYQIQPYNYSTNRSDLRIQSVDAEIAALQAYWAGLSARYEFNPQDALHFGVSAVAGFAFTSSPSPFGLAELSATYAISNLIGLEAGLSVDVSQVNPASSTSPPPTETYGVITSGPMVQKLTTTAFGGRLGIVFHP